MSSASAAMLAARTAASGLTRFGLSPAYWATRMPSSASIAASSRPREPASRAGGTWKWVVMRVTPSAAICRATSGVS